MTTPNSSISHSPDEPSSLPQSTPWAWLGFISGGNRPRLARGFIPLLVGSISVLLLMALDRQWRWSVPVGFLLIVLATLGAFDATGSFDDKNTNANATTHQARQALVPLILSVVACLTTMTAMAYARGIFWGIGIGLGWITTCVFSFRTWAALGWVDAEARPLKQREGFWLIVFCCVLYLPTLGTHSLIDPWETHYGEVSREILARNDWITIWWAEEGYFLSKPILDFWAQALAMATFGVNYRPDGMIAPTHIGGPLSYPEWVVRFPSLVLSVLALYLAYRAIAQVFNRRAALLGTMVLATMADWAMLSHQSITDMPFVASLTASMSLLIIGLTTSDEQQVQVKYVRIGRFELGFSAFHLAIGFVFLCAMPQALYLISRNIEFVTQGSFGFAAHGDEYRSGSGQLCWLPPGQGNPFERLMRVGKWACDAGRIAHPQFQPLFQGLLWLALLACLLIIKRNERRVSRLCVLAAWVFASLSTMGKGVAGFLLPIAVAGIYIVTARKWRDVLRLELICGVIILATIAAPWFVAMYVRMGDEFIQQLFVHHMFKRALDHVHDTNTGDDVSIRYYVWQLGYALFPWVGLVPAGLLWWARHTWFHAKQALSFEDKRRRDVTIFLIMWFLFAWALFTYMKTKFHHYIFPAIPPAALLTGIFLDHSLGHQPLLSKRRSIAWLGATVAGAACSIYGFSRLIAGPFFGRLEATATITSGVSANVITEPPLEASPILGLILGCIGLALCFVAYRFAHEEPQPPSQTNTNATSAMMFAAMAVAGSVAVALVTRDLTSRPAADIKGQERLIQLFTYRYDRVWPKELLFNPALLGFGVTATALTLGLAIEKVRKQALVGMLAVATLFTAWNLNAYMVNLAPHWGQRPLFEAYYKDRKSVREPIVAFEMNWKGENFYSGGRLIEFGNGMGQGSTANERSSERMRGWINEIRSKTSAIYVVTEANRVSRVEDMLRGTLGNPPAGKQRWLEAITTDLDDNKFMVFRARWNPDPQPP